MLSQQLDPYYVAPLWPDSVSIAALQARAWLDTGHDEGEMAEVAARSRRDAQDNQWAQVYGDESVDALLAEPYVVSPLRKHDCPPISDGATAIVLAVGDRARDVSDNPVWIRGIDHRIEAHGLGVRDLAHSPSTKAAGEKAGVNGVDVAELHAPFSHQELILARGARAERRREREPVGRRARGERRDGGGADAHRRGGAPDRHRRRRPGRRPRHLGPGLQQNLVCVLEGEA